MKTMILSLLIGFLALPVCSDATPVPTVVAPAAPAPATPAPNNYRVSTIILGRNTVLNDANLGFASAAPMQGYPAPSRITGGTSYKIIFEDANNRPMAVPLLAVFLFGYSQSGQGQVLVHSVGSVPTLSPNIFTALSSYAAAANNGTPVHNLNGQVFLQSEDYVGTGMPGNALFNISELDLTLEDYGNADATAVVELVFPQTGVTPPQVEVDSRIVNPPPVATGGGQSGGTGGTVTGGGDSGGSTSPPPFGPPAVGGGECTVFNGCAFPNSCQNGWCVAPGGGGGECTVFSGCDFPNSCTNGYCAAPGGGGGQCTPFSGCSFPNSCNNGWCVAP